MTKLTKNQIKSILGDPRIVCDEELSAEFRAAIYRLPDGRVMYVCRLGKGAVWPSLDAFLQETAHPTHELQGFFEAGEEFIGNVSNLCKELARICDIPFEELDLSLASLKRLDQVIFRKDAFKFHVTGRFEPLVAYLGEVIRLHLGGEWKMDLGKDKKHYEPILVNTKKGSVHIGKILLKELTKTKYPSLFAAFVIILYEGQ